MTVRTIILAAVTTTAAAAGAGWYATASRGANPGGAAPSQPSPAPSAPAPGGRDVIVVCVAADDVVHAPTPEGGCAAGQRTVELDPEKEECPMCPPFDEPKPDDSTDNEALNDLERRIRALENAPYFEVVNDSDQTVFRVAPDGVSMFNTATGVPQAMFGTSESGDDVRTCGTDVRLFARVGWGVVVLAFVASGGLSVGPWVYDWWIPSYGVGPENGACTDTARGRILTPK